MTDVLIRFTRYSVTGTIFRNVKNFGIVLSSVLKIQEMSYFSDIVKLLLLAGRR